MLATLNSKQIVDEIVKDIAKDVAKDAVKDGAKEVVKDNDPHDAFKILPDIVRASRPDADAATLAPDPTVRAEPKIAEPKVSVTPVFPTAAPSVDTAVREAANDLRVTRKRSRVGRWLAGASLSMLFAAGSAAATIAWQAHGDTAKEMIAAWVPTLTASQATPAAAEQPAASETQVAAVDQPAAAPAEPPQDTTPVAPAAAAPVAVAVAPAEAPQALQSMTRDLAAMGQQIEQLKATIAELKAGQEQMAREMAKASAPKPAEAKIVDPRARVSALPPKPTATAVPPVRKPKPAYTSAYAPSYAPMPIAPPPSQAAAIPPPPAPTQAVADDDGPVVRPPMPVR
ncbi:hypothetical protein JQ596_21560 [Bradyrhizobium manausense]|uniref:hypothetical protein n=1 Tax=Bradyrhizobium TaxID=374 RepID=UPI001BAB98F0|nr:MULTISPECIES: hypothetical protein [Bradyrhizobium]MBR0828127.1 hypothetical protein [Bradyrhizobium manausense]UVO32983.1 hypothetical protein KUF59_21365 [Bradyrhizobium arachidis]